MRTVLAFALTAVLAAASLLIVWSMVAQAGSTAVSAEELGLSKTSVFDTPAPAATAVNTSDPGDRPTVAPEFPQQPPVIPHGILDFLPVSFDENECMDCHAIDEKEPGEPTPIPPSHYVDLRNAPNSQSDELAGARYLCISCHVSPGDNEPLVQNDFESTTGNGQ
jgi:cytochrome c-type protein NapB